MLIPDCLAILMRLDPAAILAHERISCGVRRGRSLRIRAHTGRFADADRQWVWPLEPGDER